MKSLYEVLNLSPQANEAEIKKSYRKLAMKYHPDRFTSASEEERTEAERKFKEINHAYEVLSDPDKKLRYDRYGVEDDSQPMPQQNVHIVDLDLSGMFNAIFESFGRPGFFSQENDQKNAFFSENISFTEMLRNLFNNDNNKTGDK